MKFWELTSAFRTETENLEVIFAKSCWNKYRLLYENLEDIVAKQDRKILDEIVPFQLAKEVCALSKLEFYLYFNRVPCQLSSWKFGTDEEYEVLNASEVLFRFGGHFIEETMERSISAVQPRQIGEKVEILGVYKLKNVGMVAFLRTENGAIGKNAKLSSVDGQRRWIVIEESFNFIDSSKAAKREQQARQGIRLYRILPMSGSGKPQESEILIVG